MPENFYKFTERQTTNYEVLIRKMFNCLLAIATTLGGVYKNVINFFKGIPKSPTQVDYSSLDKIQKNSLEEIWMKYTLSKILANGNEVEINIENDELQNIVDSDEASIFIMNHDKQRKDPQLFAFFNALLTREYINSGKGKSCPRSKIIINKDILDTGSENKKKLAEFWGAVGIDANIHCTNHLYNGKIMARLINEIVENKTNLFIFPEGRMCAFSKLSPQWKFQTGIADVIKKVAQKKDRVKVIPLGFAYKNKVGSVHIGEPLYFKKEGDEIVFTPGTVDKKYQDTKYTDYVAKNECIDGYYKILEHGEPVKIKNSGKYIAGILCENLVACKNKAKESIANVGTEDDNNTIYVISENE